MKKTIKFLISFICAVCFCTCAFSCGANGSEAEGKESDESGQSILSVDKTALEKENFTARCNRSSAEIIGLEIVVLERETDFWKMEISLDVRFSYYAQQYFFTGEIGTNPEKLTLTLEKALYDGSEEYSEKDIATYYGDPPVVNAEIDYENRLIDFGNLRFLPPMYTPFV